MQIEQKRATVGSIPSRLRIFTREPAEHNMAMMRVRATEAMVIKAGSKEDTARYWVAFDPKTPQDRRIPLERVTFREVDNEPIPWLQVVGLDLRSEGGRAWKVLTPDNLMVDLRDDVFLEVLFSTGIPAGGKMQGPFQWVQLGSVTRLVLVDSPVYNDLARLTEQTKAPRAGRLSAKELEVGGVYCRRDPQRLDVYMGQAKVEGKKRLLWLRLCNTDKKKWPEEILSNWRGKSWHGQELHLDATLSCSQTTKVGEVQLPSQIAVCLRVTDGWGSVLTEPVVWIEDRWQ